MICRPIRSALTVAAIIGSLVRYFLPSDFSLFANVCALLLYLHLGVGKEHVCGACLKQNFKPLLFFFYIFGNQEQLCTSTY